MKQWVAAAVLVVAAIPARADDDTFIMVIDAGRMGVMMDQSQRILGLPDDPPGDGNTETFNVLKNAVRQYQRLLPVACARHLAKEVCETAYYAPGWLGDAGNPAPAVLRKRIDEAMEHMPALWGALCDTLPKEHDESLCQLE